MKFVEGNVFIGVYLYMGEVGYETCLKLFTWEPISLPDT